MNLYKDLAVYLNNNNINNFSIGQHEGKCIEPFVVIEEAGEEKNNNKYTLKIKNIDLVIFYPQGHYSELEDYVNTVIDTMEGYTRAVFTGNVSDVMIEKDKEAYIVVLSYKVYKGI